MEFRTELLINRPETTIGLSENMMTIGSCFADDIGTRLVENKFKVLKNPFGTIYNPISIHHILNLAAERSNISPEGFIERDGFFYHHDFHSEWTDRSIQSLKQKLENQLTLVNQSLLASKYLIITYGTAWVYKSIATKVIVSNCHKVPQNRFDKFLLTQKKTVESFEELYSRLKKSNPNCRIILTVSPVRHIKDTLELNSVSKSVLRLSCHTLSNTFKDVEYFPAYEIMMDDLRDYRFYKPDMIHPSSQAIDYIWGKFTAAYFNEETSKFIQDWSNIQTALQHRPFHPESKSHQQFLKDILERVIQLKSKVDVDHEIEIVKKQLESRATI